MSGPVIETAGATMPAANNPTQNNDYFEIGWDRASFALLDGRVNHDSEQPQFDDYAYRAGATVSRNILTNLCGVVPDSAADAEAILKGSVREANSILQADPAVRRLQTTATIGMIRPTVGTHSQADAYIAHVGDSTVYRFRDSKVEIITPDHTAPFHRFMTERDRQAHLERQTLFAQVESPEALTGSNQEDWPMRHALLTWLGHGSTVTYADIGFEYRSLMPGDVLLATSDGVGNNLSLREMGRLVAGSTMRARDIARLLVRSAAENSQLSDRGRRHFDDATAVVTTVN